MRQDIVNETREGQFEAPVVAINDAATRLVLRAKRGAFPNLWGGINRGNAKQREVLRFTVDMSFDGGKSWHRQWQLGTPGGEIVSRRGLATHTHLQAWLPAGKNRLLRIVCDCRKRIDLHLDVETFDTLYPPVHMFTSNTVAYGGSNGASSAAATSIGAAITPTGSDRLLLAQGGLGDDPPLGYDSFSSDLDGALTEEVVQSGSYTRQVIGSLVAPTAAANTITFSRDAAYMLSVSVHYFTTVDQATPLGNWSAVAGANPNLGIASTTGDMVAGFALYDAASIAVAAGTSRWEDENYGPDGFSNGMNTNIGTGTVNVGWTAANGTYSIGLVAANINDAGAGPSGAALSVNRQQTAKFKQFIGR